MRNPDRQGQGPLLVLALMTGVPNDTIRFAPLSIGPFNRYSRIDNQRQNARITRLRS
jgi:hypothetical protein